MDTGDGPKDNNGEFPIEGDLEKGSEANVTEDGGNNKMEMDYEKLFKELDDDNTSAVEQGNLEPWIQDLADGNTSAVAQGDMHMGQGGGGGISAMPTVQTIRELDYEKLFKELDDDNTSAVEQGNLEQGIQDLADGNTSAVAQGGMHMGQGNHQGGGGGISAMPTMQTISEPVHEEILNKQSNVGEGRLAPPASTFFGGCRSAAQTVRRERPAPNGVKIKVVTRRRQTDKPTQYEFDVDLDEDVASLRVLLADKTIDLPLSYCFYYNMAVMNESFSFRRHRIDGVRVPKIEVMDVTANSQHIIVKRKNSQDDAGPSIHKTEAAKKIRNV